MIRSNENQTDRVGSRTLILLMTSLLLTIKWKLHCRRRRRRRINQWQCSVLDIAIGWSSASASNSDNLGYLPFTWENWKFQLEDQMVRAIPFGKLQKIWALICGDAIFLLFKVSRPGMDRLFCNFLPHNIAFNCLMFMPEISNRMVFLNGKHL